jgi:hypothetical protein
MIVEDADLAERYNGLQEDMERLKILVLEKELAIKGCKRDIMVRLRDEQRAGDTVYLRLSDEWGLKLLWQNPRTGAFGSYNENDQTVHDVIPWRIGAKI